MSGLYVHIPFCRQRCSYCDFYFVTGAREIDRFVEVAVNEINSIPDRYRHEDVDTLYFGGGTPSRLSGGQLGCLVSALETRFNIGTRAERTVEINPEDADGAYLASLAELGFNRLSVGIQSLQPSDLEFMRRAHTSVQARVVVDTARDAGFEQLSVDLIFGLPDQSVEDWMAGVEFMIEKGVPHVSTYGLTVEPKTILAKWIKDGLQRNPDDDMMADMYLATIDKLTSAGYRHYEVSSFAIPGFESRHNSAYWDHTNYLGIGPSAHSFWWEGTAIRWNNVRSLNRYIAADFEHGGGVASTEALTTGQLASERVMLGLRTSSGISRNELADKYRHKFSDDGERHIVELARSGRLRDSDRAIQLTPEGRLLLNAVTGTLCDNLVAIPSDPVGGAQAE